MIIVDQLRLYRRGTRGPRDQPPTLWCHMMSDESIAELHAFAEQIGMRPEWFQATRYAHYDLLASRRRIAVKLGAIELGSKEALLRNFDYRLKKGLP